MDPSGVALGANLQEVYQSHFFLAYKRPEIFSALQALILYRTKPGTLVRQTLKEWRDGGLSLNHPRPSPVRNSTWNWKSSSVAQLPGDQLLLVCREQVGTTPDSQHPRVWSILYPGARFTGTGTPSREGNFVGYFSSYIDQQTFGACTILPHPRK